MDKKFAGFIFLVTGIFLFAISWHGIDNAWNMQYLEHIDNSSQYTDTTLAGVVFDKAGLYRSSSFMMFYGFFLSLVGAYIVAGSMKK